MIPWEQRFAGVLSALRLHSIRNKLTALVLVAVLVPTLTTAGISYLQNKRSLTEKVNEELQGVGSNTARELDYWARQTFYDIGVFSSSFEVTENLELISASGVRRVEAGRRLQEYVSAVQERISDYRKLQVVNASGEVVASSDESSADIVLPDGWAEALRSERTQMGEPTWDDNYQTVVATLAEPITSANTGRYLGALVAKRDFEAVAEDLTRYAPGSSGNAYLVNRAGAVITSSIDAPRSADGRIDADVLTALSEQPDRAVEYDDMSGSAVLGTIHQIDGMGWSVIAEVDRAEAYAPIGRLRNVTMLLVSCLLGLIGAVAYVLGLFIVRPLERLTTGAAEVAGGDLSVDLPITGRGELAELTGAFNHMVQRLRESRGELERLSMTDGLTGLTNRRRGMEMLLEALSAAVLEGGGHEAQNGHEHRHEHVGLLMMDVDHFKQYNDAHGHLEGDDVLKGVARVIQDFTGGKDTSCRYGGEEFMVVLPGCDVTGTLETAERLRSLIASESFSGGRVTMSIGAAVFPAQGPSADQLIEAADQALYEAKRGGRNRVVLANGLSSGLDGPGADKPGLDQQGLSTDHGARSRTRNRTPVKAGA